MQFSFPSGSPVSPARTVTVRVRAKKLGTAGLSRGVPTSKEKSVLALTAGQHG